MLIIAPLLMLWIPYPAPILTGVASLHRSVNDLGILWATWDKAGKLPRRLHSIWTSG